MADLAGSINTFLQSKGSPMAGLGSTFVAAGQKYGVDPRLMVAISGAESSFGKHVLGDHNAWGWGPGIPFGSWQEGITRIAQGLRSGYINQGLTTPAQISTKWAPSGAANDPHGLNANWTSNVSDFMNEMDGQPVARSTRVMASAVPQPGPPPQAQPRGVAQPRAFGPSDILMSGLSGDPMSAARGLIDNLIAQPRVQPRVAQPAAPVMTTPRANVPATAIPLKFSGAPVMGKIIGTPYQGTHARAFNIAGGSNNWESENAVDVSVPVGTPIRAVTNGTIGPQFGSLGEGGRFAGLRLHLNGQGQQYYYAHLSRFAPGIRPGARVRAGQIIGFSGEANGVPHLHFASLNGNPTRFWQATKV